MLLHGGGPSLSDRASFTLQVRFGNFLDPVANEKGWPGSIKAEVSFMKDTQNIPLRSAIPSVPVNRHFAFQQRSFWLPCGDGIGRVVLEGI